MQLRGASPKHCGGFEINAHMVPRELGSRKFGKVDRVTEFGNSIFGKRNRSAGLVIAVQFLDGPFPTVTLVRDEALQHSERSRFSGCWRGVFDQTGERRYSVETRFLGQVPAD